MKLVIIESPNKIKKLQTILPKDFTVVASVGHMFDLPKKELGIDLDSFEIDLVLDPSKEDILDNIKQLSDSATDIYLATDDDREGSSIAKNIFDVLSKKNQKKCKRLLFNAITKDAVLKGLRNPTTINLPLCEAQKGRRVLDRLVGYKVSPVLWGKGLKGTSAGRVQSVALKYIIETENEISSFVPEQYFEVRLKTKDGIIAKLNRELKTQKEADDLVLDLSGKQIKVLDYTAKQTSLSPYPPFDTATLQQSASSSLGWNAQKTMQVAQDIFSQGLITYIRTESFRVEQDKIDDVRDRIEQNYSKAYVPANARIFKNKNSSHDAHEAIRPTYDTPLSTLTSDQSKLLKLITARFEASQMEDALFDKAKIKISVGNEIFEAAGSCLKFDGFTKVWKSGSKDEILPFHKKGDILSLDSFIPSEHWTKPKQRYNDASLIKKLESDGVGRPSTYASIIETIISRGYVERDGKALKGTELGQMVFLCLNNLFSNLVNEEFTAKMEESLDLIEQGKADYKKEMKKFWKDIESQIIKSKDVKSKDLFCVDETCPKCNEKLLKKKSDSGIFLACSGYPKCKYIKGNDEQESSGKPCPKCDGELVARKGGSFWGCTNYPSCTHIEKEGKEVEPEKQTKSKCPKCSSQLVERKGKFGRFFACKGYPKCKYTWNIKE